MEQNRQYRVEVRDVFSGDDLVVWVDLDFEGLWKRQRVRLYGIDTPNAVNATDDTEAGRVRKMVRGIARNRTATMTVKNSSAKTWVVVLVVDTPDGPLNLNDHLSSVGFDYKKKVTE